MARKFYTANEAARHLNVCLTTFWMMRKNCPLESVRISQRKELFEEEALEKWFMNYDPMASYRNA